MAENMIKFLRGNVASLPATATEGAVYFTKDEGLYLGLADGTYHRYGDFITVDNVDALPAAGAHETCMYYCVAENILAKWDGSAWVQINKQKTLAELGGVAKSVYEAKMAALEKADTDNATAIAGVDARLKTAEDTLKTVATSASVTELAGRVTTAEGEIDVLQAAIAEDGSVTVAIADAKKAGTDAQKYAEGVAADLAAYEEANDAALAGVKTTAEKGVTDAATAQAKADSAYTLAEGKATMDEVETAIAEAGHAVKADVDQAFADMEAAYKLADTNLETKLQGEIDKKVAKADYDIQVAALDAEDERLAGLISDMDEAYKAADEDLDERISALESDITGLSGAMHFRGVVEVMPETTEGYADGDTIIFGNKEYVVNGESFVELGDVSAEVQRISDLEGVVGDAESGLVKAVADNATAIANEKKRAEEKEAELAAADATNLAAAKKYTDDEIAELNIGQYAKQSDLDAHTGDTVAHVTADDKAKWNASEKNAKDYADGLKATIDAAYAAADASLKTELQGYADQAEADAKKAASDALAEAKAELEGKISDAETAAKGHADTEVGKVQTALNTYKTENDAVVAGKADKATTLAGYGITDSMTKTEIETAISDAVTAAHIWGEF